MGDFKVAELKSEREEFCGESERVISSGCCPRRLAPEFKLDCGCRIEPRVLLLWSWYCRPEVPAQIRTRHVS
eukprot:1639264-Rhodomonas_salina.2